MDANRTETRLGSPASDTNAETNLPPILSKEGLQEELAAFAAQPQILIEITSRCNFACTYCASSFKERAKQDMSMDLFEHIAVQLPDFTRKQIRLHVDGEPTLHPEFLPMARRINDLGLQVAIATNGSMLREEFLSINGAFLITISTSAEEFACRHPKLPFEHYAASVRNFLQAWAAERAVASLILQVPIMDCRDRGYLERKAEFLREFLGPVCGVEGVNAKVLGECAAIRLPRKGGEGLLRLLPLRVVQGVGLYPRAGQRQEYEGEPTGFCDSGWKRMAILVDGSVGFCCVDLSGKTAFTNPKEIWTTPLRDIWMKHQGITDIRSAFMRGHVPLQVCRSCLATCKDHTRTVGSS